MKPTLFAVAAATALATTSPALADSDWTGFYGGAQLGYANVDTNISGSNGDVIGGLIAGYDYDLGTWVVGGGFDYDFADVSIANGAVDVESVWRAKLRAGVKVGDGLAYGTGGYAQADTDILGSDDGYFIGLGYEHMVTENFSVGGELLYHEFDNFSGSGVNVDATTMQVRGAFRF